MNKIDSIKYKTAIGALTLLAHIPLRFLYPVSSLVAWILQYVVKYRLATVEENLKRAFPDASDKEIRLWTKQTYSSLCDTFIEAIKLLAISDKEVDRRIEVFNAEIVDKAVTEGQSVVLFLGHYGNWEWVPAIVRHFRNNAEMVQIYHPLSDEVMDMIMLKIRSRFGSESIPMANTYRRLVEIERNGSRFVAGFISDQRPRGHHTDNWTEFMGVETDYISGGEVIGNRLKCKYIYLDVKPERRGHYSLTFEEIKPMDDGKEFPITRSYLQMLEKTIRRDPPYWLWTHKRFRHTH